MTNKNRNNLLIILASFCVAATILVILFFKQTYTYAISEAEKQIETLLLMHKAIHTYVKKTQKPEIYRLKDTGKLYKEYFNPKILSFTYIARHIKDNLNLELKKFNHSPIYFKSAAINPRNLINKANQQEQNLLKMMNAKKITKYSEIITKNGLPYLYFAMPVNSNKQSCLRCHGDPKDAPQELIERYGSKAGFYEKFGEIRALISIRIPLKKKLNEAKKIALYLSTITIIILIIIFIFIVYFICRLDQQQHIILQKNKDLEILSKTDTLTGIDNRLKFNNDIYNKLELVKKHRQYFIMAMLDLDFFKLVNDNYGHNVGDEVLIKVAKLLTSYVKPNDLLARWGGEEFIFVFSSIDITTIENLLEHIRQEIIKLKFKQNIRITASIGLTICTFNDSLETLIERTDKALYHAKNTGRNRISYIKPKDY
jgi:diguanylate cyclase (GGDEF)-like protein